MTCPRCGEDNPHNILGHEILGVYDGVLYWVCMKCGIAFPRDFGDWERLNALSRQYVDAFMMNLG